MYANTVETQMLNRILGLGRSDDEREADHLRTANKAEAAADRLIAQAREAMAAGHLTAAETLLNRAQANASAAARYRAHSWAV